MNHDIQAGRQKPKLVRYYEAYDQHVVKSEIETVSGIECHVLELTSSLARAKNERVTIWFAHNNSMLPMKYQELGSKGYKEEIVVSEIAKSSSDFGEIWYPTKANRITENIFGKVNYSFTATKFIPNAKTSKDDFVLKFPDGTEIIDKIAGISYISGDSLSGCRDKQGGFHKYDDMQKLTEPALEKGDSQEVSGARTNEKDRNNFLVTKDNVKTNHEKQNIKHKSNDMYMILLFVLIVILVASSFILIFIRKYKLKSKT